MSEIDYNYLCSFECGYEMGRKDKLEGKGYCGPDTDCKTEWAKGYNSGWEGKEQLKPNLKFDHAYAIIRIDNFHRPEALIEDKVSVVKIIWDVDRCSKECIRLNKLSSGDVRYIVQIVKVEKLTSTTPPTTFTVSCCPECAKICGMVYESAIGGTWDYEPCELCGKDGILREYQTKISAAQIRDDMR